VVTNGAILTLDGRALVQRMLAARVGLAGKAHTFVALLYSNRLVVSAQAPSARLHACVA